MEILPILIDSPDRDHARSLAGSVASAIGRTLRTAADEASSDPRWVAARLDSSELEQRTAHVVAVDSAATVADVIDRIHRTEPVDVGGGRSYPVIVGAGARCRLPEVVPPTARRAAIVTQQAVGVDVDPGIEHQVFTVEEGERAKRLEVVGELASAFARSGLTRNDVIIAVGGGVVTDLGGFAASVYHRGIPVIHVATTLLGQIDAAIGGKCGVNLAEGKNLVGSFWQPNAVLCDTDTLVSLPERDYRSGLGELAKYHFLGGGELDALPLVDRIAACIRIKADVVVEDEREGGRRAILNYGHTLAHALEAAGTYEIRHGEAVAMGLVYAAEVAHRLGRISAIEVEEHRRVVEHYGHSVTVPPGLDAGLVLDLFARDKKALDGITFVLGGPRGVEPVRVDDRTLLLDALEAMR